MKKVVFLTLIASLLVSGFLLGAATSPVAADGHSILEFDTMVGVPRPYTGSANAIRGVSGGGLPWVLRAAQGELKANGKVEVRVFGLVIDPNDPAAITAGVAGKNPITSFEAIVSCLSKDASGNATTVNVATKTFPASPKGKSVIKDKVTLPKPCIAPIVFVASPGGAWFAATGN